MNEDFVPFELAKKLEEKGFNWKTLESYTDKIKQKHLVSIDSDIAVVEVKDIVNTYPKPTISQVLKWLREEKNISIEIYSTATGWGVEIYNAGNVKKDDYSGGSFLAEIEGDNNSGRFDTYEEAALAGLEYVIGNLI